MLRGEVDITPNVTAYAAVGGQHSQRDILSPEPVISNSQGDFIEYFSYRPAETRSTTGEAGVRVTFSTAAIQHEVTVLDGRLQIMGGIRHQRVDVTDYTNGVSNSCDKSATTPGVGVDPATRLYSVNGEQRNRGLEFSVMGEPVRGVRVLGGAMLLDAVLTSTPDSKNDGDKAAGAPKWVYRAGVESDTPFVPSLTLRLATPPSRDRMMLSPCQRYATPVPCSRLRSASSDARRAAHAPSFVERFNRR
ncbi:hypothetical protein [Achromobacter sp. UMC46]|uniref:hypothetical protein n=1 Tax=Achromobacter sp. UMC46 TaxID=1862319 RepID=UPI0015FF1946|nr:hypothetical protein [Achromobacter sp. UMC46]MBB1596446.1 hypothetical protein [Achromobacter sp. UMC46]